MSDHLEPARPNGPSVQSLTPNVWDMGPGGAVGTDMTEVIEACDVGDADSTFVRPPCGIELLIPCTVEEAVWQVITNLPLPETDGDTYGGQWYSERMFSHRNFYNAEKWSNKVLDLAPFSEKSREFMIQTLRELPSTRRGALARKLRRKNPVQYELTISMLSILPCLHDREGRVVSKPAEVVKYHLTDGSDWEDTGRKPGGLPVYHGFKPGEDYFKYQGALYTVTDYPPSKVSRWEQHPTKDSGAMQWGWEPCKDDQVSRHILRLWTEPLHLDVELPESGSGVSDKESASTRTAGISSLRDGLRSFRQAVLPSV